MFDNESLRVVLALVMVVVLSVGSSIITVTGNLQGRDKLLGWLAWTTFWAVLIFSALKIDYPGLLTIVFGGLVAYFSKTVLGDRN